MNLAGQRIEAEGLVWPLETFMDSHGFVRRPNVADCRDRFAGEIEVIDDRLALRHEPEARHLDWHSILAVRPRGDEICLDCGCPFEPVEPRRMACMVRRSERGEIIPDPTPFVCNSFESEYCEDCQLYGEWEY